MSNRADIFPDPELDGLSEAERDDLRLLGKALRSLERNGVIESFIAPNGRTCWRLTGKDMPDAQQLSRYGLDS